MTFHEAYLGKRLQDLMGLSHEQMQQVYERRKLVIPVEGSSTLQALRPGARMALADLARSLEQPHQLVAQRLKKLTGLDLVNSQPDPNDRRRTEYVLSPRGEEQWHRLDALMNEAVEINRALFAEIGMDLISGLEAAIEALHQRSFLERFPELNPEP